VNAAALKSAGEHINILQGAAVDAGVTPLDACTRCSATAASRRGVHTEAAFF